MQRPDATWNVAPGLNLFVTSEGHPANINVEPDQCPAGVPRIIATHWFRAEPEAVLQ